MKAIISPAKNLNLNLTNPYPRLPVEKPLFDKEAETLIKQLRRLSPSEIGELMSISPKLAELNHERFQKWRTTEKTEGGLGDGGECPAVYMFSGDVYQGLDAGSLSPDRIKKLNSFTYILSGLYGLLRPLTLIRPYRLEMGSPLTKLKVNVKGSQVKSLYGFWGDRLAQVINTEAKKHPILVNLASEEYYRAVKPHLSPELNVIHPVFLDRVKGKYRMVSFYAKKARGMMLRHLSGCSTADLAKPTAGLEQLKKFQLGGYRYSEEFTREWDGKTTGKPMVFLREGR